MDFPNTITNTKGLICDNDQSIFTYVWLLSWPGNIKDSTIGFLLIPYPRKPTSGSIIQYGSTVQV